MNNKINKLLATYTREQVEDLYIKQNLTKRELCEILHVGTSTISKLLSAYDLHKSTDNIVATRRSTNLKRYGVDNPFKSEEIKHRIQQTCLDKYGVTHHNKTAESKARIAQTKLERYGDAKYNNAFKNSQTKQERYGDPKYNNRAKCRQTVLSRYGVENALQLGVAKQGSKNHLLDKLGYCEVFREM